MIRSLQASFSPGWVTPAPSAASHQICAPAPFPAPFSRREMWHSAPRWEKPQAPQETGSCPDGKQLCREGPGEPGGNKTDHEPAGWRPVASCAALGRTFSLGWGRQSFPSVWSYWNTSGVPGPVLDYPVQKTHGHAGGSPEKAYEELPNEERLRLL